MAERHVRTSIRLLLHLHVGILALPPSISFGMIVADQRRKAEYDQHRNAVGENEDGTVQTISDEEMARIDQVALGMAALVKVYGDTHDRKVHYAEDRFDTNLGILWRMKVSVDGIELGQATRANKKTAKNVAALEAARALGLAVSLVSDCSTSALIDQEKA